MHKHKQAFTLVELIVVITILAILGTIAFISLQGYSKDARDSVRISDISKIKTSLELFQLDAGKYPETTEPTNITYSGAIAWTQGTFGEATFNNITKLDKIPLDPMTDKQYVYSVTNTKQEYQLAGIMEGDEVTGFFNQTNAAIKTAMVKISGNFNGKLLKVSTGTIDYILAMPSIVTSSGTTIENIVLNNLLAYNGYKNLPAQYAGSSYEILGEDEINLVNSDDLVIYSGDLKTLSSTELAGKTARKNLIEKLKSAYNGTAITGIGEISQIINTDIEDETATEFLGSTIVSNNLGGSISASSGGIQTIVNSCDDTTKPSDNEHITFIVGTPTSVNQEYVKDAINCGYICTDGYIGDNCEIAPILTYQEQGLCDNPDIHVPTGCTQGETGCFVVAACNLGTATSGTTSTSIGHYYQFGRNTSYENGTWTDGVPSYYDWLACGPGADTGSANNWGVSESEKLTATYSNQAQEDQLKMQGPCPTGYHVPTYKEWTDLITAGGWNQSGQNMLNALKIPITGYRKYTSSLSLTTVNGLYWSSSPSLTTAIRLNFTGTAISTNGTGYRSRGQPIRCFKN